MSETEATEAYPEAAALLAAAGWKPHDAWNVYTRGTIVMGFEPSGLAFHAKNWALDVHGPDTPDDPVEAAAWLVARFPAPVAAEAEPEQGAAHEAHEEAGAEAVESSGGSHGYELGAADDVSLRLPAGLGDVDDFGAEGVDEVSDGDADNERTESDLDILDADFSEPLSLGAEILDADEPEHAAGAFIFGDNLHEKRTAAIGLVVQIALRLMPEGVDYPRLAELRNFTMGVSEGRWPDDAGLRAELDTLEAVIRRANLIAAVRDEKVAGLVGATREEIEAFDPEVGWP